MEQVDLSGVNSRLRDSGTRVTILQRKQWLYLRAVLPPKPESDKVKAYRQELTRPKVGLPATTRGIKDAEKVAIALWGSVIDGSFEWDTWRGKVSREQRSIKEWIAEFREHWLSKGITTENTWHQHWGAAYKRLPQDKPLTGDILLSTLLETDVGTYTRKRTMRYFQRLAEFADIPIDLRPHGGTYAPGRSEARRDLPGDELIEEWWNIFPDPAWQWVYAAIGTFGLRPHEAFFLEPTPDPLIWNVTDGKTGYRQVSALYPEWVTKWGIGDGNPPPLKYPEFRKYGKILSKKFRTYKVPFQAYDLRHAFAVRCIKFDISVSIAAKMMGHSVKVHTETYQRWLSAAEQQAVYHRAIAGGPKPPSVSLEQS